MSGTSTTAGAWGSTRHRVGFYAVIGLVTLAFAGFWAFEGYYVVTAWFPSLYDEVTPINGVAAGGFMTLLLACSIATLARPRAAIGPTRVLLIGAGWLGLLMPAAFVLTDPLVTVIGVTVAAAALSLVGWLHPARNRLFVSKPAVSLPLVGLTVLLAIPFLWLAAHYQWQQVTLDDEIAERWFYGGLSMYLLVTLSLAAVGSVDASTRRFTAGSAALLAGLLALVSVVHPDELHSLGLLGGLALLAWAGCVVVLVARE